MARNKNNIAVANIGMSWQSLVRRSKMEHRYALRKPVTLDVVVTYQALGLVQGRTMNVGLGGMFIKTGCVELPVNALVKASFYLHKNGEHKPCSIDAMVMHSAPGQAGVMFNDLDDELHADLHRLLNSFHDNDDNTVLTQKLIAGV